jgi:hypothetical protein
VLIYAPAPSVVGEIVQDKFNRCKGVIAVVERQLSHVANETDVFIMTPYPALRTKVDVDRCKGLTTNAVAEDSNWTPKPTITWLTVGSVMLNDDKQLHTVETPITHTSDNPYSPITHTFGGPPNPKSHPNHTLITHNP